MSKIARLLDKALPYYELIGFKDFLYELAWEILFWLEGRYRNFYWSIVRKKQQNGRLKRRVKDFDLFVNIKDKGLSVELSLYGMHEPLLIGLLKNIISKGMVVVDIGANIGYFPLVESKLVGNEGKIIAIEPFPDSYNLLKDNIKLNNASNFICKNLAISDQNGKAIMYSFDMANWNSLLHGNRNFSSSFEVQTSTLDTLLETETKIDAIRMDIEGYECNIIDGMKNTLMKHKPLLIVELHGGLVSSDEIATYLKKLQNIGFDIKYIFPRKKDEIFFGFQLVNRKKIYERLSINELLEDIRLIKLRENFTIIFAPHTEMTHGADL